MNDKTMGRKLLVAGTGSGCGKTSLVCAMLRAFQKRGLTLAACKCGPDYIDPLFHEKVLGIPSENLDLFFHSPDVQKMLFGRHSCGKDLTIAEGVMGYYDGMHFSDPKGSTSEIAEVLDFPVVLVVPCRGMGHSILPFVKGFVEYEHSRQIRAVILNGMTERSYEKIRPVLEAWFQEKGYPIKMAGYFPTLPDAELKSRHLGLILPSEIAELQETLDLLAFQAEKTVDLNLLLSIAGEATETPKPILTTKTVRTHARIAVAKDEAFCFYYKDNLEFLKEKGCEILPFSPLHDSTLPEAADGVILAGGYPELYAKALSENTEMRTSLFRQLSEGLPCLAECGGFLYLKEELEDKEGAVYPMVGYLEGKGFRTERLGRFGYLILESGKDLPYLKKGETLRGHEFHYWDCTENGSTCRAFKPDRERSWECMEQKQLVFAGFPHISFYSNPVFAERFVGYCLERREKRNAGNDMEKRTGKN